MNGDYNAKLDALIRNCDGCKDITFEIFKGLVFLYKMNTTIICPHLFISKDGLP